MKNQIWLGAAEASKNLGISQATLWNLKAKKVLKAGVHWLYVTGLKKSNVKWNVDAIRQWQIDKTIYAESPERDKEAAARIVTYQPLYTK